MIENGYVVKGVFEKVIEAEVVGGEINPDLSESNRVNIPSTISDEALSVVLNNPTDEVKVIEGTTDGEGNITTTLNLDNDGLLATGGPIVLRNIKLVTDETYNKTENSSLLNISNSEVTLENIEVVVGDNAGGNQQGGSDVRTGISLNSSTDVTMSDVSISGNIYNGVELPQSGASVENVVIDGLHIEKTSNNGLSIYNFAENSNVSITNSSFGTSTTTVSNAFRFSNYADWAKNNGGSSDSVVNIKIENVTANSNLPKYTEYTGLICLQDNTEPYTGDFSDFVLDVDNVQVNVNDDVSVAATYETIDATNGVSDTQLKTRLVYIYKDDTGIVTSPASYYPKANINGVDVELGSIIGSAEEISLSELGSNSELWGTSTDNIVTANKVYKLRVVLKDITNDNFGNGTIIDPVTGGEFSLYGLAPTSSGLTIGEGTYSWKSTYGQYKDFDVDLIGKVIDIIVLAYNYNGKLNVSGFVYGNVSDSSSLSYNATLSDTSGEGLTGKGSVTLSGTGVSGSGSTYTIKYGSTVTVTTTVDEGYTISVYVNGILLNLTDGIGTFTQKYKNTVITYQFIEVSGSEEPSLLPSSLDISLNGLSGSNSSYGSVSGYEFDHTDPEFVGQKGTFDLSCGLINNTGYAGYLTLGANKNDKLVNLSSFENTDYSSENLFNTVKETDSTLVDTAPALIFTCDFDNVNSVTIVPDLTHGKTSSTTAYLLESTDGGFTWKVVLKVEPGSSSATYNSAEKQAKVRYAFVANASGTNRYTLSRITIA